MMTLAQAMEKVEAGLTEHLAEATVTARQTLEREGWTDEAIEIAMEQHLIRLAEWKAKVLTDTRKWLERGGEDLH